MIKILAKRLAIVYISIKVTNMLFELIDEIDDGITVKDFIKKFSRN